MNVSTKGTLLVIIATLIFGFMGIAAKYIQASPIVLLYSMQIFGLITISIILLKTRQFSSKNYMKLIIVMSFFGLLTDFFFFSAVKLTSVPNSVFVRYTAPIFILILMPFMIKEKIERKSIYAIPIALVGLFIILYQGNLTFDTNMTGMIFALLSAVTNASALVLVKKIMLKLNVYTMMFYRFLINTIILTPFILIGSSINTETLPLLALFGIVFAGIGITLHFEGISRIKIQRAGVLSYIDPLSATFYSILLFSEIPSIFTIIGGLLILLSSYLAIKN